MQYEELLQTDTPTFISLINDIKAGVSGWRSSHIDIALGLVDIFWSGCFWGQMRDFIYIKILFTTAVSIPKSFHLTTEASTLRDIDQP